MVRAAGRPPRHPHRISGGGRRRDPERAVAPDRPRTTLALLAHAVPVRELPGHHVQELVAYLVRRLGDPPVRPVLGPFGARRNGGRGAAPEPGPSSRGRCDTRGDRQTRRGNRRAAPVLRRPPLRGSPGRLETPP